MQNNMYQNMTPPPYAAYQPPRPPVKPPLSPKEQQRRTLRSTSNGMGFFILAYFLVMQHLALILSLLFGNMFSGSDEAHRIYWFLLEIIVSCASSLLVVVVFRKITKRKFSDNFNQCRLKADMLIPVILVGMGAAMIANQLASLFDQNISLFELKNTVSQTSEAQSIPEIILYIVSTAIVPAFAEELAFRGVLMNVMRRFGDAFAILTSAVLFGAMHGNTTQIVFAFVLGLIFAYVDCKANSIIPSVIIHFANNFFAVTTDVFSSNSGLDDGVATAVHIGIVTMFSVLGILSYIYLAKRDRHFFRIADGDKTPYAEKSLLSFKEKNVAAFTSAGFIVSLVVFFGEMLLNLIPQDVITDFVRGIAGG